jgi:hypothetical protein
MTFYKLRRGKKLNERNSTSHISKFLVQNVLFLTPRINWTSLIQNPMLVFFSDSSSSKAYRVYSNRTLYLEEFMHVHQPRQVHQESTKNI